MLKITKILCKWSNQLLKENKVLRSVKVLEECYHLINYYAYDFNEEENNLKLILTCKCLIFNNLACSFKIQKKYDLAK